MEAQIRNLEAQALYYNSIANPIASPAALGVLGTLLGAIVAFSGIQLQAFRQAKSQAALEDLRWKRTKEGESRKEERLAIADLAKKVAIAAHYITWVLWIARNDPDKFTPAIVREHDKRMIAIYADIVAAQVVVAALDEEIYRKSLALIERVYKLDGELGRLARDIQINIEDLGSLWSQSRHLETEIPESFLGILCET